MTVCRAGAVRGWPHWPQDGSPDLRSDDRKQREAERDAERQRKQEERIRRQKEREQAKERECKEEEAKKADPLPTVADLGGVTIRQMRVVAQQHDIPVPVVRQARRDHGAPQGRRPGRVGRDEHNDPACGGVVRVAAGRS